MIIDEKIIEQIYYADLFKSTPEEMAAGDDILDNYFNKEKINPHDNLGIDTTNMVCDYAAANMKYSFINGFRLGAMLMTEVFSNE